MFPTLYADLGPSHFDRQNTERLTRHYLPRLEDLGLQVTVQPLPEAAQHELRVVVPGLLSG